MRTIVIIVLFGLLVGTLLAGLLNRHNRQVAVDVDGISQTRVINIDSNYKVERK